MLFNIKDRIMTPKGPGIITRYRKSSYSNSILFYYVKLDNPSLNFETMNPGVLDSEYLCPVNSAEKIFVF